MRKLATIIAIAALCAPLLAQDSTFSLKPTPPPISCLDFSKGTWQVTGTGIYMKLGQAKGATGDAPTGMGFNVEMARGFSDGFGLLSHFMYLGLNIPMKDPMTNVDKNYPASATALGATLVVDLVKGEKRDIAGEIIEKKPTVALFAGFDFTGTSFVMEDFMNSGDKLSVKTTEGGLPVGLVADIPLNYYISLVPFGRFAWSSTTMKMIMPYPYTYYTYSPPEVHTIWLIDYNDSTYTNTRFDYGMDIDLRLFRNAPEWKISVGTVLSQVEGLSKGNLLIMASVKREWGKHYSSTSFGPKLH
jgi:hypothetical protein